MKFKFLKNKIIIISLIFLLLFLSVYYFKNLNKKHEQTSAVINVYNWGAFMAVGSDGGVNINKQFTRETGIKVNYSTYQSNEEMYAKIMGGGTDYDLIIPSDYMIANLIKKDKLAEINFENIPNYVNIDDAHRNLDFDPENKYSVPYSWGFLGIFYNEKYVREDVSWDMLWNEKYKNKILLVDSLRDMFAISLIRLGKNVNSHVSSDWHDAANELKLQRPIVQNYIVDQIFDKLNIEEAYIAPFYFVNNINEIFSNKYIKFGVPKEGTNKFVDSVCILKSSKNKKEAETYINFLCRQDIAYENVKVTGYLTPNSEVVKKMPSNIYDIIKKVKNIQVYTALPDDINKLSDELWVYVKSGQEDSHIDKIFFISIILCLLFMHISLFLKEKTFKFWE
ncbi:MAG: spermidine/putrescine ABC transporter substrate-binding protein [Candidatus Improbicoccus devescovinae]|nr:MAG: spermidine/putrescine ABC transporter substrate-binding protein [Candidatus Improbicoccus devescovinae]